MYILEAALATPFCPPASFLESCFDENGKKWETNFSFISSNKFQKLGKKWKGQLAPSK